MARHIQWLLGAAAAAMTALAGCDPDLIDIGDVGDDGDIAERGMQLNGFQLNSFRLNSFRLNGYWLGPSDQNNIKLAQAHFAGGPKITQAWLVGGELHVATELGDEVSGGQLGGAQLVFDMIKDGVYMPGESAKIVSAKLLEGTSDVWLYDLLVQDEKDQWQPLCVDKNNAPTEAILLTDLWDPTTGSRISPRPSGAVTLACRGAALAKCVEWGYAPWRVHDGVSLAETHQACTRAVRADYCGDGTPHTVNGVEIHVKDPLGIQKEDLSIPHVVEAEWGPGGALCLNDENTRLADANVECDLPACDAAFLDKGKLQTGKLTGP